MLVVCPVGDPICLGTASTLGCSLPLGTFCGLVVMKVRLNKRPGRLMCVWGVPMCSVWVPGTSTSAVDCVSPEVSLAKQKLCLTPPSSGGDAAQFLHESLLVRALGL